MYRWQSDIGDDAVQSLTAALGLPEDRTAVFGKQLTPEPTYHCTLMRFDPEVSKIVGDVSSLLHSSPEWSGLRSVMEEDTPLYLTSHLVHEQ